MNTLKIYEIKMKLRSIRESMIQLHNKQKAHNENIVGASIDLQTIIMQKNQLLDQYIDQYNNLRRISAKKKN